MILTEAENTQIREALESSLKPLIFFHDDPDGLSSYLLLWRHIRRGHGIIMKSTPRVTKDYLQSVKKYQPDAIFIVDLAVVDQEFLDECGCDVYWIDHHEPLSRTGVNYFNPRKTNPSINYSATELCFEAVGGDMWIAMVGSIGDWTIPQFKEDFAKKYPELWSENVVNPDDAIFDTKLGELIKVFSFVLKGSTQDAMRYVEMLKTIRTPNEILNKESEDGIRLFARSKGVNQIYQDLLEKAELCVTTDPFVLFTYSDDLMALAKDMSNEMLHKHKDKYIVMAREKNNEMKISIRSAQKPIRDAVKKSLEGLSGTGGGHEMACGANMPISEFKTFLNNLRTNLGVSSEN